MSGQEIIHLRFQQLHLAGLLFQELVLQQQDVCVGEIHHRSVGQDDLTLVGLMLQDGQCCPNQPITLCGVEKGRLYLPLRHGLQTDLGSCVDANHLHVYAKLFGHIRRCDRHAVVVGINQIHLFMYTENRVANHSRILVVPVAIHRGDQLQPVAGGLFHEALVPLDGWCRTGQTMNLNDLSLPANQVTGIMCGGSAKLYIVHTLIGRVGVSVDVSVEHHDRNPLIVDFLHDGCDGICLIRSHNDSVEMLIHKILQIGNLLLTAVICRADLHGGIPMKHDLTQDLVVAFVAPVIGTAL